MCTSVPSKCNTFDREKSVKPETKFSIGAKDAGNALTGPFCPPKSSPTAEWKVENGVYLLSELDCGPMGKAPYNGECGWRARWCETHNIPTGCIVPVEAIDLINYAFSLRDRPEMAEPIWTAAYRVLLKAQHAMRKAAQP